MRTRQGQAAQVPVCYSKARVWGLRLSWWGVEVKRRAEASRSPRPWGPSVTALGPSPPRTKQPWHKWSLSWTLLLTVWVTFLGLSFLIGRMDITFLSPGFLGEVKETPVVRSCLCPGGVPGN